jgi:putative oxidoreductase
MDFKDGLLIAGRVLAGGAFLIIGLRNIPNHKLIGDLMAANKVPLPGFAAAIGIAMQVGFGALMVSGFYPTVAALGLAAFTVLATLIVHHFWTFPPPERATQVNAFLANTVMIGGFLALASTGL